MEGTNGCREHDRCSAMCLGFGGSIGFESDGSMPLVRCPAFSFIGQEKARVIVERKGKNEKEKKSSRIAGSFISFTRVPLTL